MRRLRPPAGEQPRDRVADPAEAARLVAALERLDDRSLWAVAVYCGLRAGELRALRWRHVDLARGRIRVDENLPARQDGVGADESSVVCESLARTGPHAARRARLQ
jgi:integrase